MNNLNKDKLSLHLKLGRNLYQFVGIGVYFESKTFEYLSIEKNEDIYTVKLVQALDGMYSFSPSMNEFETVESLESECKSTYSGTLEQCLDWANSAYNCSKDKWVLDLIDTYTEFVDQEVLGQGDDHL